jgi:hypothetical protein
MIQQLGAGDSAVGIESRIPKLPEHSLHHFTALVVPGSGNIPNGIFGPWRNVNAPSETRHNGLTARLIGAFRRSLKRRSIQLTEPCRKADKH